MIAARITQVIIAVLFVLTTFASLLAACLGIILPGLAVALTSVVGIWAVLNSK